MDCTPPGLSVVVADDSIPPSDVDEPSLVLAGDSVPPAPSDVEEPSLGVTDGGMLGRGLPSQGSLVGVDVERAVSIIFGGGRKLADLVIGHPGGSFSKAEANFEELKVVIFKVSHIPHASKRENMNASTSFMVSNSYFTFYFTVSLLSSVVRIKLEHIERKQKLSRDLNINYSVLSPGRY